MTRKIFNFFFKVVLLCSLSFVAHAEVFQKGIYINRSTIDNTRYLDYLIKRSKRAGINTFVIDTSMINSRYARNVRKVRNAGLRYVARVVIFPRGGNHQQITSQAIWKKRYRRIKQAIALGASEIQLDYIRYNTRRRASRENAKYVYRVIRWYKDKLRGTGVPLQICVFGETSFGPSLRIGQNVKVFADTIDVLSPMLYPSHYEPFRQHSLKPYWTVSKSLRALKRQFNGHMPFKVIPYIEASNYRYRLNGRKRHEYIQAQIKAVHDHGVHGWYVWSANNKYDALFNVLDGNHG